MWRKGKGMTSSMKTKENGHEGDLHEAGGNTGIHGRITCGHGAGAFDQIGRGERVENEHGHDMPVAGWGNVPDRTKSPGAGENAEPASELRGV
jgi:hypothetical protein